MRTSKNTREFKGNRLDCFPTDYVVIDLETTGYDPHRDEIIELGALRIHEGEVVESFSSLTKPQRDLDDYIIQLTGISNEMLASAPELSDVFPRYLDFIGDSIVVGHNVHFDVNFIYDTCIKESLKLFTNDLVDLLWLSRKLLPDLTSHKLCRVSSHFNICVEGMHRSLFDCKTTFECFEKCRILAKERYGQVDNLSQVFRPIKRTPCPKLKACDILPECDEFDEAHPLFNKVCVFTGALEKMTRSEAMQAVVNFGGTCKDNLTKKTNFLILGNNSYCSTLKDGKSTKQKKAESYKLTGADIEIISENVFYDMILDNEDK
ncbi:BRCA1 C-terminal domain protein [[Clostridium] methylpentosum DSM 5476]|uniref:BRCA1 C-terminal domain protein n=1 Tax=[Clostridium] methylpentosum DSM 5476 TaxID=537013 RepID=C0EF57_9FIRM|nr:BRCA1 C-terminal domain protein [[Clostridium] methylpentosum DSM 5476]MEE1492907.1 exonuclease domain-containing protein [Massilioclostridium sp.]